MTADELRVELIAALARRVRAGLAGGLLSQIELRDRIELIQDLAESGLGAWELNKARQLLGEPFFAKLRAAGADV